MEHLKLEGLLLGCKLSLCPFKSSISRKNFKSLLPCESWVECSHPHESPFSNLCSTYKTCIVSFPYSSGAECSSMDSPPFQPVQILDFRVFPIPRFFLLLPLPGILWFLLLDSQQNWADDPLPLSPPPYPTPPLKMDSHSIRIPPLSLLFKFLQQLIFLLLQPNYQSS